MPSGFTPVVNDLRPSVKVMIPRDKPVQRLIFAHISGHRKPRSAIATKRLVQNSDDKAFSKSRPTKWPMLNEFRRYGHLGIARRIDLEIRPFLLASFRYTVRGHVS
jgi:hypothetical protein